MSSSAQSTRPVRRGSARSEDLTDIDDAISLTSTTPSTHDPDHDFNVDDVLAESVTEEGERIFLIQWEGYPLCRANWELAGNLCDELMQMWEEKKARIEAGEEEDDFQLSEYQQAVEDNARAKADRHRRRNIARKRLGEPPTEPIDPALRDSESSDEAWEDNATQDKIRVEVSQLQSRPPPRQRLFKTPVVGSPEEPVASTSVGVLGKSEISGQFGAKARSSSEKVKVPRPPDQRPPATLPKAAKSSTPRSEAPSTTGYQGTARKSAAHGIPGRKQPQVPKQASISRNNNLPHAEAKKTSKTPRRILPGKTSGSLTARKTGGTASLAKPASTNAFVSGKPRKMARTLGDVMSDPTKDQKLFKNHRLTWMAEKRGREKGDAATDIRSLPGRLFSISGEHPSPSNEPKSLLPPRPAMVSIVGAAQAGSEMAGEKATSRDTRAVKRKSVRFAGDDDEPMREEPMDIDAPVVVSSDSDLGCTSPPARRSLLDPPLRPASRPLKASGSTDQPILQSPAQSVVKIVVFGVGHSDHIEISFNGLPRDCQQPWFAAFENRAVLDFGHLCFSETFTSQLGDYLKESLCHGTVSSLKNETVLGTAGEHLRSKASGLLYTDGTFNILIYPTRCDEWKLEKHASELSSPSDVHLWYLMFSSAIDCGAFLRRGPTPTDVVSPALAREDMMRRFFRLGPEEYAELMMPHQSTPPGSGHLFYLAFPPSLQDTQRQIGLWLRRLHPGCEVYAAYQPGSWTAFLGKALGRPGPTTVLIHECVVWTIRRFPGLFKLISNPVYCSFWYWSQSIQSPLLFPSAPLGWGRTEAVEPETGYTTLVPLLPHGTAILLTPSFLLSEPKRAFELFDWFIRNRHTKPNLRLVTGWNIVRYLKDLGEEKVKEGEERLAKQPPGASQVSRDIVLNLHGVTNADCVNRLRIFQAASELVDVREARDPWSSQQDTHPIVYADNLIDSNDEQSLVNWFGWWSNLRLDRFREFHVVGSSFRTKKYGANLMRRMVPLPAYTSGTTSDPDAAYDPTPGGGRGTVGVEKVVATEKNDAPASHPTFKTADGNSAQLHQPWAFKSDILKDDSAEALCSFLMKIGKPWAWRNYGFPVLWIDGDEAYGFQVLDVGKTSMSQWWNYTWPFGNPPNSTPKSSTKCIYSTYVGFFYTVMQGWDRSKATPGQKPRRQPWLAVYRVNPYTPPFTKTEVIIWDPTAPEKFADGADPREEDLLPAQRALVQLVREKTADKNPGTTLATVWLGGFRQPPTYKNHIDITLDFLRCMVADLREYLPIPAKSMLHDFRKVQASGQTVPHSLPARDASESETRPNGKPGGGDESMSGSPDAADLKMIFHPPRRPHPEQGAATKCRNHLYEAARLAKMRDNKAHAMEYEYRPTMEWYEDQKAEGRGYEHINIDTWEEILNHFKIGAAS